MKIELKNLSTGKALTFDDDNHGYILQDINFGQVVGKHNTTQYINLIGSHVNNTVFGERDVSIQGCIFAKDSKEMEQKKPLLNKLVNPRHEILVTTGNYTITIRPDTSIQYGTGYKDNNDYLCKFLIQGTAFNPLFKLKKNSIVYESSVKPISLFPLRISESKGISFGYVPAISIKNIINDGDVETGFIVRFKAKEGNAKNPRLTNNLTGKFIETIVDMVLGDEVVVSTLSGNKYAKLIRGEQEVDIFPSISKASSLDLTLNIGMNDMSAAAAGNSENMNTSIEFSPMFLEVQ